MLLFLLTRFAGQFFLFSHVMVVRFGHEGSLVRERLTRTLLDSWRYEVRDYYASKHWLSVAGPRCALRCPLGHGASRAAV